MSRVELTIIMTNAWYNQYDTPRKTFRDCLKESWAEYKNYEERNINKS